MATTLRAILPQVAALLLGFGLLQMGNTLQGTLLSIRGDIEGFSPAQIGIVGASFWAGIVVGSLRSGMLIERVGHVRTFAALGAIASTIPLLHLLLIDPIAWVGLRAVTGFCFAGLFIVVESWLNGEATVQTRGQILSIYGMTGLMAGIAGQLLLPATDATGFRPFCMVAITLALSLVPLALSRSSAPAGSSAAARINPRELYRQSRARHRRNRVLHVERHAWRIYHGVATGLAIGSDGPAPGDHRRFDHCSHDAPWHGRRRTAWGLRMGSVPLCCTLRRYSRPDLQYYHRSSERCCFERGIGWGLGRFAAPQWHRRNDRAHYRRLCYVGRAARTLLHARCCTSPDRFLGLVHLDATCRSGHDTQRTFLG